MNVTAPDEAREDLVAEVRDFLAGLPPADQAHQGFQLLAALAGQLAGWGHRRDLVLLLETLATHAKAGPPAGRVQ